MSINSLTQPESIIPPTWTALNVHNLLSRTNIQFDGSLIGQLSHLNFPVGTPLHYLRLNALGTALEWDQVTTDDLPGGANNTALITNNVGAVEWSNIVSLDDVTVTTSLDVLGDLEVAGNAGSAYEVLQKDAGNNLIWGSLPLNDYPIAQWYVQLTDLNDVPAKLLPFELTPSYSDFGANIVRTVNSLQFVLPGVYECTYYMNTTVSASTIAVQLESSVVTTFPVSRLNPTENFISGTIIVDAVNPNEEIRLNVGRIGGDLTAKDLTAAGAYVVIKKLR